MERREYRKRYNQCPENAVYVLDYLPYGDPIRGIRYPLVQSIGEERFLLIELKPATGVSANLDVKIGERIALVGSLESQIFKFSRFLKYEDLTSTARAELPVVLEKVVRTQEKRFVEFFNTAQPISKKAHQLDLLKGIGKRTLWKIINERRRKPFESFKDISERTGIDPVKLIVERIIEELREPQTYYLFVKPIRYETDRFRYRGRGRRYRRF